MKPPRIALLAGFLSVSLLCATNASLGSRWFPRLFRAAANSGASSASATASWPVTASLPPEAQEPRRPQSTAATTNHSQLVVKDLRFLPDASLGPAQQATMNRCDIALPPPRRAGFGSGHKFYKGQRMPDFFIAGTQKSGTSACARNLVAHPSIFIPRHEVHFFDEHLDRGPAWYASQLAPPHGQVFVGDKTPSYAFDRLAPKFMHQYAPNAKVVLILREPIARAFSAYRMRAGNGLDNRTFGQAVRDELRELGAARARGTALGLGEHLLAKKSQYVQRGFYYAQIRNVLQYFPRCQLHIAISERLAAPDMRVAENHRLLWFLGLASSYNRTYKTFNVRTPSKLHNASLIDWDWDEPNVLEARTRLKPVFDVENARLFEFLGRRIPEWDPPS